MATKLRTKYDKNCPTCMEILIFLNNLKAAQRISQISDKKHGTNRHVSYPVWLSIVSKGRSPDSHGNISRVSRAVKSGRSGHWLRFIGNFPSAANINAARRTIVRRAANYRLTAVKWNELFQAVSRLLGQAKRSRAEGLAERMMMVRRDWLQRYNI